MTTTNEKKSSHPPSHVILADSIRHNIAQTTSTSKPFTPCLVATISKWCHRTARDKRQHCVVTKDSSENP